MATGFETALTERIDDMVDACTRCGKCVEVCPVTDAAGVAGEPAAVIGGVLDLLRGGDGTEVARKWASGCVLTGECVDACDYGVNPRFLLAMARMRVAQSAPPAEQRRRGVENFRKTAQEVTQLSRMQLDDELLARLGQGKATDDAPETPDFVFYTGCNVLKTPHMALLCLDIMDKIGVTYRVMGGPSHCCGVIQMRTGDTATFGRFAEATMDKLAHSKSGQVVSWCPSCQVQFTENTLPTVERMRGARPFEMTPFTLYLRDKLDRIRDHMTIPVPMRVALHRHPGIRGAVAAAEDLLRAVPGVELVDLAVPAAGLQATSMAALPHLRKELQLRELEAARDAGIDALVAVYHTDHRELCAHERDWPFRILNLLEVVGESMALRRDDHYKRLKMLQDVDAILADCNDLIVHHGLDIAAARSAVENTLKDQPIPLRS